MLVPGFVVWFFVSFLVLFHLAEEDRAGCFTFIGILLLCVSLCSGVPS